MRLFNFSALIASITLFMFLDDIIKIIAVSVMVFVFMFSAYTESKLQ
jgi:hypothetical protein